MFNRLKAITAVHRRHFQYFHVVSPIHTTRRAGTARRNTKSVFELPVKDSQRISRRTYTPFALFTGRSDPRSQLRTATTASEKSKVVVITGPTAVGKTNVSLLLAEALGGEIISADSVQVYKGLNVGSDKVLHGVRIQTIKCNAALRFSS